MVWTAGSSRAGTAGGAALTAADRCRADLQPRGMLRL